MPDYPMQYRIEGLDGRVLDAQITLLDNHTIALASRGGSKAKALNPDYSSALAAILKRALAGPDPTLEEVELASSAAIKFKPSREDRILATGAELAKLGHEAGSALLRRKMERFGQRENAKGGNSTKRLVLTFKAGTLPQHLRLRGPDMSPENRTNRLPASVLHQVLPEHIHAAVLKLASGGDAPNFADSTNYDLVTPGGLRFAPKKVFALALEAALGFEPVPGNFSAGQSQACFAILRKAGYDVVDKLPGHTPAAAPGARLEPLPPDLEEQRWAEGSLKRVSHLARERQPGLAEVKKAAVLAATGRLACEECGFEPAIAHGPDYLDAALDVHHRLPLAEAPDDHTVSLADLALLCATCHRLEHRRLKLAKT